MSDKQESTSNPQGGPESRLVESLRKAIVSDEGRKPPLPLSFTTSGGAVVSVISQNQSQETTQTSEGASAKQNHD